MTADTDAFDALVADLDYPMFIVTATADGEQAGCLVGFATQVSIDPQRLLVMLSKQNRTYEVARRAQTLAVHFLGADNDELAALFGEETGDRGDKFASCAWSAGPDGVPVLAGTRGCVVGRVIERVDTGDHVAHLLETIEVRADAVAAPPLSYQAVRDLTPGHDA
jgi:flavin reductase (DIM6/NTAB) family NADH-FMN oxidoreductase RutF